MADCKNAMCTGVRGGKDFEDDNGRFDNDVAIEDATLLLPQEAWMLRELPGFNDVVDVTIFPSTGRIPLEEIADRSEHNEAAAATASIVSSRSLAFKFLFSCRSLAITFDEGAVLLTVEVEISMSAVTALSPLQMARDWCPSRSCDAAAQRYSCAI